MDQETTISTPHLSGEVFDSLPPSIQGYIRYLEITIQRLQTRIQDLESRISKNSSNSSKPPSSDGLKRKTKSQRPKSDKKPGAQIGHVGKGLSQGRRPDLIVTHTPVLCKGCGHDIQDVHGECAEKRQIFDIPQPKIEVIEHRVEEKRCPCCGAVTKADFPGNVRGPVQYGERVQALAAYFAHQHFVPVDRVCQILQDIFDVDLSPGTSANVDDQLYHRLEPFERDLRRHLLTSRVLYFDETGVRCEKKLHWIHVASSQAATLYAIEAKRGQEAMDKMGILPRFTGAAVHDHWAPYFSYEQVGHCLCNAHHLRELTFVEEQEGEKWAAQMKDLLLRANRTVEDYLERGALPTEVLLQIESEYTKILKDGAEYHALLPPLPCNKGRRQKQRAGKNLLDRLQTKRWYVVRFLYNFEIPFTNNQGERDIRMVKLKQKISGCFRTSFGGQIFCRIRSYISTARKQGWNIWEALADAIRGSPKTLGCEQNLFAPSVLV
jgi:transposase